MLARWLNNELDEKELKDFMASPEYRTYSRIKEYSAQLVAPEGDMDSLYERVKQNKHKKAKVRALNPWLSRIAAVLVLALGATYFLYTTHTTTQMAANGQHTAFVLPDNSSVTLNAGSKADYRTWNWNNNRKVELEGEAFFKVAKGKTFDVTTQWGIVTVVGTQFNVKNRADRFEVTCFEGKVKVSCSGRETLLAPGKSIAFENGKMLDVPATENLQPGWINYEASYSNEKFANIIAEMERQYNIDIIVKGNIPAKRFNGPVPLNDIDTALEAIASVYQLKTEKTGDKIILSSE